MLPDDDYARMLERILAPTPARVLDATMGRSAELRAELDAARETLASVGLSLPPEAPSEALRGRVAASLVPAARPARREALIVLDMLVDHLTPGRPLEVSRARAIVPAVRARIDAARAKGDPVVYLCDRHEPDDPDLAAWGAHAIEGTEGAEVVEALRPEPGDAVIPHRTYSGFFGTNLDETLRALGTNTLVITGCITEMGILFTAADAMMRGYAVEVPPDAQAGASAVAEQVALATLAVMHPVAPLG
jgi:nicotinamidase/pyrazinamidase